MMKKTLVTLIRDKEKRIAQLEAKNKRLSKGIDMAHLHLLASICECGEPLKETDAFDCLDALKEGDDPPDTHATLQQRIFDWGRNTFGAGQRSKGVYAHLVREIKELGDDLNDGEELADCAILLLELAGFAGVDLLDEIEKKHKVNQGRKWGGIEEDGSILHIKDGG